MKHYKDLPVLVRRCLVHGVQMNPHMMNAVLYKYSQYKIPDEVLESMSKEDLTTYVKGLNDTSYDEAYYWSRGHDALKLLGFVERTRIEGHRNFISLVWENL